MMTIVVENVGLNSATDDDYSGWKRLVKFCHWWWL